MPAQKILFYLGASPNLRALSREAQKLAALQRAWKEVAPPGLAEASTAGALKQATLIVYADNGAVASKIRQMVPRLLMKLKQRAFEVTAIRVAVQAKSPAAPPPDKRAVLSAGALAELAQLAGRLGPSPLKDALETLVSRHSHAVQNQPAEHQQGGDHQ
jgi:hypothetical protein